MERLVRLAGRRARTGGRGGGCALLMMGLVFGGGRRVVAAWLRAAGLSVDYRDYYYFLQSVGRAWPELGRRVLVLVLRQVLKHVPRVLDRDRRFADEAVRAESARGRHSSRSDAGTGGGCVLLRTHLGHAGDRDRAASAVGDDRAADLVVAVRAAVRLGEDSRAVRLDVSDEAPAGGRPGADGGGNAAIPGEKTLWVVTDGAYAKRPFVRPAAGPGRDVGRPVAEGLGAARSAAEGEDQASRQEAEVRARIASRWSKRAAQPSRLARCAVRGLRPRGRCPFGGGQVVKTRRICRGRVIWPGSAGVSRDGRRG